MREGTTCSSQFSEECISSAECRGEIQMDDMIGFLVACRF